MPRHLDVNYEMVDTLLGITIKEKDLGMSVSADMNISGQCGIAASELLG